MQGESSLRTLSGFYLSTCGVEQDVVPQRLRAVHLDATVFGWIGPGSQFARLLLFHAVENGLEGDVRNAFGQGCELGIQLAEAIDEAVSWSSSMGATHLGGMA